MKIFSEIANNFAPKIMRTKTEKIAFYRRALGDLYGFLAAHRMDVDCIPELLAQLRLLEGKIANGDVSNELKGRHKPWWERVLAFFGIKVL